MLVVCNYCHSKARILTRETVTVEYAKLRCQCCNPDCGHRFVSELSFSHTTTPPLQALERSIIDSALTVIKKLPIHERRALTQQLLDD